MQIIRNLNEHDNGDVSGRSIMASKREVWITLVVIVMTIHAPIERLCCFANVLNITSALGKVYDVFGFASHVANKNGVFLSRAVVLNVWMSSIWVQV